MGKSEPEMHTNSSVFFYGQPEVRVNLIGNVVGVQAGMQSVRFYFQSRAEMKEFIQKLAKEAGR